MNPFNRKILRDIASYWHQVIAIVAVLALGIVMFTGPLHAQKDLRGSINRIYRETLYEDFSVSIAGAESSIVRKLARIKGVAAVEGRLIFDVHASFKGGRIIARVISLPAGSLPGVNRPKILRGRFPREGATPEFVAAHQLAGAFDLKTGDRFAVSYSGRKEDLKLCGVCVSPEYLRLLRSRSEYVTDPKTFGVIFTDYGTASRLYGTAGVVNDIAFRVLKRRDLPSVMERAKKLLSGYGIVGLSTGWHKPQTAALNDEVSDIGKISAFFTVLILLVSSLSIYITMTRIVRSQHREIGVIRALGYSERSVVRHYLLYGVFLGVAGSLLGITAGYLLSILFIKIYAGIFNLPFIRASFSPLAAFLGILTGSVFSLAGTVIPARQAVRMKPAEAMRNGSDNLPSGTLTAKFGWLWRKRSMTTHRLQLYPAWLVISIRNVLRSRRRAVVTAVGIAATVCLMTTASGGKDSLDYAVRKYSRDILKWDVAVVWEKSVDNGVFRMIGDIPDVERIEPLVDIPVSVSINGRSVDLQLNAYKDDTMLHGLYPVSGRSIRPGFAQVLLNRGVGKELSVKEGDTITIQTAIGALPFTVAGFVSEPFAGVCYVSFSYIQFLASGLVKRTEPHENIASFVPGNMQVGNLIEEALRKLRNMRKPDSLIKGSGPFGNIESLQKDTEVYNAVIISLKKPCSSGVIKDIQRISGDGFVVTKEGILKVFNKLVRGIKDLFYIFYIMAFAMGFSILFSMVTVNAFERRREVATMRTLGAGRGKIFSFLTVEIVLVTLVGILPGIAAGRFLQWLLIDRLLMSGRIAPDSTISPATLVMIGVATLTIAVIAEIPAISALLRLDLARVTKERAD